MSKRIDNIVNELTNCIKEQVQTEVEIALGAPVHHREQVREAVLVQLLRVFAVEHTGPYEVVQAVFHACGTVYALFTPCARKAHAMEEGEGGPQPSLPVAVVVHPPSGADASRVREDVPDAERRVPVPFIDSVREPLEAVAD